jgi:hypothetical protein
MKRGSVFKSIGSRTTETPPKTGEGFANRGQNQTIDTKNGKPASISEDKARGLNRQTAPGFRDKEFRVFLGKGPRFSPKTQAGLYVERAAGGSNTNFPYESFVK